MPVLRSCSLPVGVRRCLRSGECQVTLLGEGEEAEGGAQHLKKTKRITSALHDQIRLFVWMLSDDLYRVSTQYRRFSYASQEDLLRQRAETNAQSRAQLPPETDYLSVTEEIELVDYFVSKLWELCRLFRVPSHVKVRSLLCR